MMKNFSKQIETLRRDIADAIRGKLEEHGLTEITFPDPCKVKEAPDTVYVIYFDRNGEPYECAVRKVSLEDASLSIHVLEKYSGEVYTISGTYELAMRSPVWLNEIYEAMEELLDKDKH